jgi:hypothetical protein
LRFRLAVQANQASFDCVLNPLESTTTPDRWSLFSSRRRRAVVVLAVLKGYKAETVYARGRIADPSKLPKALRERIRAHRQRLVQLNFEGSFRRQPTCV